VCRPADSSLTDASPQSFGVFVERLERHLRSLKVLARRISAQSSEALSQHLATHGLRGIVGGFIAFCLQNGGVLIRISQFRNTSLNSDGKSLSLEHVKPIGPISI